MQLRFRHRILVIAAIAVIAVVAGSRSSHAVPIPGFVENWTGTSLGGWGGGSTVSNPGSGGTGGGSDGYLRITNTSPGNLGSYASVSAYIGDWVTAGVVGVRLWLNDVGAADALEIHFSIGRSSNFWQYDEAFVPLNNQWREFVVDLTNPSGWTRIIGSGTFQDALQNANRIHLRHDLSPFTQNPNQTTGDFGVDQLMLTDQTVDVQPTTWGRIKSIYR